VQFASDALHLAADDPRPRSVTGGLPYYGGPSSNYMSHSISHIVSRLRAGAADSALCTGIGMHMTKHVAAVWARSPGAIRRWDDHGTQHWGHPRGSDDRHVVDHLDGTGALAAATVVHDANGEPDHVIAICNLGDGARCYARTGDEAVMTAVLEDRWANQGVRIEPTATGANAIRLQGPGSMS
jgi:acetyl-CoA C-acetyltransferase